MNTESTDYLLSVLTSTWCNDIKDSFMEGMISSESHLQAEWFSILKIKLRDHKVFVEPIGIIISNKGQMVPDLIITKELEIVAIVELKFHPHSYLRYNGDKEKIKKYLALDPTKKHHLLTNPTNGEYDSSKEYSISKQTKFVFAGIGREGSSGFKQGIWNDATGAIAFIGYYSAQKKQPHFERLI